MPNLVNVTIDGKQVAVPSGSTVLDAAIEAGIDVPTLCHHPDLEPIGACRICLVEIEGQRTLQPACTFPATEGLVIHTESEAAVQSRKFILQLLLSERNHYCMYCQMSGDCDLQNLAYRYGLDNWLYPRPYEPMPVDASRQYFVMDHSRCILCRKCVRVCHELVGNGTLGLGNRGAQSMIVADMDVPFGDSSCISCGTCLQVCPTGALMDRKSAYRGVDTDVEHVQSVCTQCSLGCQIDMVVRNNNLIRIDAIMERKDEVGLLCVHGRFEPLFEDRKRLTSPMVRKDGELVEVSWDEALDVAASKLSALGADAVVATATAGTNEVMASVAALAKKLGTDKMACMNPVSCDMATAEGTVPGLDKADAFVVVGIDLDADHQVAGMAVKRGSVNREADVILLADGENGFDDVAQAKFGLDQVDEAIKLVSEAEAPAVVYGAGVECQVKALREALGDKAQFVGLVDGANSRGAAAAGFGTGGCHEAKGAFVSLLDSDAPECIAKAFKDAEALIVQATYESALDEIADVVLPATMWTERCGTVTNSFGCDLTVKAGICKPAGFMDDVEVCNAIVSRI